MLNKIKNKRIMIFFKKKNCFTYEGELRVNRKKRGESN
jgi:hypothetical protein